MSYTSQGRREKQAPNLWHRWMDRGIKDLHKCGEEMSKNSSLPSQEQEETSELNGSGGGRGKGGQGLLSRLETPIGTKGWPFIPVGGSNRDKRPAQPFVPVEPPTGIKCHLFVLVGASNRDERPMSPAGPASCWTRDKSHILSRAQRLPGQMVWNKGMFCSSGYGPGRSRMRC